ncbi:hypothetical protein BV25DRAFT_704152 [Artomyces pyxidatus]|uniref:Uncharacterized protein n=1 Tax=Artomyces pyxidatus TaxID=48021 RepID=A0ACB8SYX3_9AGAM|nr:hypothetical protein BV25DRAFT_704152 [Artomyces pyxidatus]
MLRYTPGVHSRGECRASVLPGYLSHARELPPPHIHYPSPPADPSHSALCGSTRSATTDVPAAYMYMLLSEYIRLRPPYCAVRGAIAYSSLQSARRSLLCAVSTSAAPLDTHRSTNPSAQFYRLLPAHNHSPTFPTAQALKAPVRIPPRSTRSPGRANVQSDLCMSNRSATTPTGARRRRQEHDDADRSTTTPTPGKHNGLDSGTPRPLTWPRGGASSRSQVACSGPSVPCTHCIELATHPSTRGDRCALTWVGRPFIRAVRGPPAHKDSRDARTVQGCTHQRRPAAREGLAVAPSGGEHRLGRGSKRDGAPDALRTSAPAHTQPYAASPQRRGRTVRPAPAETAGGTHRRLSLRELAAHPRARGLGQWQDAALPRSWDHLRGHRTSANE